MSIIPNYVPSGFKTVNVSLTVKNASEAIEFYNRAFGMEEVMRLVDPSTGAIVHAEMKFADTIIMLSEEDPRFNHGPKSLKGTSVVIQLYVPDVEGIWAEAISAGCKEIFPVKSQFYGDRAGRLEDPFGHQWIIATQEEKLTAQEMQKRFHELTQSQ